MRHPYILLAALAKPLFVPRLLKQLLIFLIALLTPRDKPSAVIFYCMKDWASRETYIHLLKQCRILHETN